MLANEAYANLVQAIGQASLHADEKQLWHLTKIYWWVFRVSFPRPCHFLAFFSSLPHAFVRHCPFLLPAFI